MWQAQAHIGKEPDVCGQNADSAAGTHCGDVDPGGEVVGDAAHHTGDEEQQQEPRRAEAVFDVVSAHLQKVEIDEQVHDVGVHNIEVIRVWAPQQDVGDEGERAEVDTELG